MYLVHTISAISSSKENLLKKRDNSYTFDYQFLDGNLNPLTPKTLQCYAFSHTINWNFQGAPGWNYGNPLALFNGQPGYGLSRGSCQQSPSDCAAGLYIPEGIQTHGTDIYFQTLALPVDSTVCVAYTSWGCADTDGLSTGDPGSGGSGYICDKETNHAKACFAVTKGNLIAVKFPWGSYGTFLKNRNAILGDTIAVYAGIMSIGSVCDVAYAPYVNYLQPANLAGSTNRYDLPQPLSIGLVSTDPHFEAQGGAAGQNIPALYGQGQVTQVGPNIYLQNQVPVFGSLRTPGGELIYKDPLGSVYNTAIKLRLPITLNLAQFNPKVETYAKCVCGTDTTIQKITPPNKLIVNNNLCTCTFYDTPPPVTSTTTFTTTKSGGSVEIESGIVIVEQDSSGSLSTSTSLYPRTGIITTTTFTTTKSGGSVEIESGLVILEQDSRGSLSTSTSLYPRTGIITTTTFTTTKSDGSVETASGIVIVEQDSRGSLSTSTSLFESVITPTASGSFLILPSLPADSSGTSAGVSSYPGGWNSSLVAPLTSKSLSSSRLTYRSSYASPSFIGGSTSSSDVSLEPVVSFPRSFERPGSASPNRSSSSVVTKTRTVVTTKTNASGVTEFETTTFTTTYCPFSTSRHAEKIGPNGSKDEGGSARHTDSSGILPFDDVSSQKSPGEVPKEQAITSALWKASVISSGIAMSNNGPASSTRLAGESSAIVTLSPSLLSIVPDKTTSPVSSAGSSSYSSSVPVYEGLARVISPMTVMIFIPILALAL